MKNSIKNTLLALTLSVLVIGTASGETTGQSLHGAVQSAVTTGNVNLSLDNGVVTLFGWVDSTYTKQAVKRVAMSFDNVTSIIDLISVSN